MSLHLVLLYVYQNDYANATNLRWCVVCRLMLVADISCDVNGSVEMLERTTNIDSPYFQYDPIVKAEVSESISSDGVTVMGVDILPTELPRESSAYFGDALLPVLEKLIDYKVSEEGSSHGVPPELVSV